MLAMSALVTEARSSRPGTSRMTEAPMVTGTGIAPLVTIPRGLAAGCSASATVAPGGVGMFSAAGRLPLTVRAVLACPAADSDPFEDVRAGPPADSDPFDGARTTMSK